MSRGPFNNTKQCHHYQTDFDRYILHTPHLRLFIVMKTYVMVSQSVDHEDVLKVGTLGTAEGVSFIRNARTPAMMASAIELIQIRS